MRLLFPALLLPSLLAAVEREALTERLPFPQGYRDLRNERRRGYPQRSPDAFAHRH